jgi:hypothetical protein
MVPLFKDNVKKSYSNHNLKKTKKIERWKMFYGLSFRGKVIG